MVATVFTIDAVTAPAGINPFTLSKSVALTVTPELMPASFTYTGSWGVSGQQSGWYSGTITWETQIDPTPADIAAFDAAMLDDPGGFGEVS